MRCSATARSNCVWRFNQNWASTPNQCPSRRAVSALTDRLPEMIWPTQFGDTSICRANSGRRHSPLLQFVLEDFPGMDGTLEHSDDLLAPHDQDSNSVDVTVQRPLLAHACGELLGGVPSLLCVKRLGVGCVARVVRHPRRRPSSSTATTVCVRLCASIPNVIMIMLSLVGER